MTDRAVTRNVASGANAGTRAGGTEADLICFSHLRWDFVYQRPQHLLSRAAARAELCSARRPSTMCRVRASRPGGTSLA